MFKKLFERREKMVKKPIEEIPKLGEEEETEEETELEPTEEPKQEENKVQVVTNEQLIQLKLDNLTAQVQQTDSNVQELVSYLKSLVEILRKNK